MKNQLQGAVASREQEESLPLPRCGEWILLARRAVSAHGEQWICTYAFFLGSRSMSAGTNLIPSFWQSFCLTSCGAVK